jgi:hypothetical protein
MNTRRNDHWQRVRDAVLAERPHAVVPALDRWSTMDDERLWRQVVSQVAVIGGVRPWDSLRDAWTTVGISWADLARTHASADDDAVAERFHVLFAKYGIRYVGDGQRPAKKAIACARNRRALLRAGGPTAWVASVAAMPDELARIDRVARDLNQVGAKGARDLLMDYGLCRKTIALDVRVMNILRAAGLTDEEKAPPSRAAYEELEAEIVEQVARPLGFEPVAVDRVLFQRHDEILARLA